MIFLLRSGDFFHDRYKLINKLGAGGYSEVWLAEDIKSNNMQVALKVFASSTGLDTQGLSTFSGEYALVFNFNHPNLLKPMHFDDWHERPYLVMQYLPNGSCVRMCGKTTEKEVAEFLVQIAGALDYLHNNEIPVIHQDIKPDNVLIDKNGQYLLTDFGISTHMRRTLTKSMGKVADTSGTMPYMGPERFGKFPNPTKESDIWSLGATIYELITGGVPFGEHGGVLQKNGAEIPDMSEYCSEDLEKLINLCLDKEPAARPSAAQISWAAKKYLETGMWDVKGFGESNPTETLVKSEKKEIPVTTPITEQKNTTIKISKKTIFIVLSLLMLLIVLFIWQPWKKEHIETADLISDDTTTMVIDTMPVKEPEKEKPEPIPEKKPIIKQPENPLPIINIPEVNLLEVIDIGETSAVVFAFVLGNGGGNIYERGVCYNTSPNPTIMHNTENYGTAIGRFKVKLKDLKPNTTYYVRAYALNEKGPAYSEQSSFKTLPQKKTPITDDKVKENPKELDKKPVTDKTDIKPDKRKEENNEEVFMIVEELPKYPGGDDARQRFLVENLKYPQTALENGIQGRVYVSFIVEKDGSITNIKVIRGIGGGCDEEAVRVVSIMPKWIPGKQRGQAVRVQFNMPIRFALN